MLDEATAAMGARKGDAPGAGQGPEAPGPGLDHQIMHNYGQALEVGDGQTCRSTAITRTAGQGHSVQETERHRLEEYGRALAEAAEGRPDPGGSRRVRRVRRPGGAGRPGRGIGQVTVMPKRPAGCTDPRYVIAALAATAALAAAGIAALGGRGGCTASGGHDRVHPSHADAASDPPGGVVGRTC